MLHQETGSTGCNSILIHAISSNMHHVGHRHAEVLTLPQQMLQGRTSGAADALAHVLNDSLQVLLTADRLTTH